MRDCDHCPYAAAADAVGGCGAVPNRNSSAKEDGQHFDFGVPAAGRSSECHWNRNENVNVNVTMEGH